MDFQNLIQCHLLLTSGPEYHIVDPLRPSGPTEVDLSQMQADHDHDISMFIDHMLQSSGDLKGWTSSEKDMIREVLLTKANGMYVN